MRGIHLFTLKDLLFFSFFIYFHLEYSRNAFLSKWFVGLPFLWCILTVYYVLVKQNPWKLLA
jgi:hypothetical protein